MGEAAGHRFGHIIGEEIFEKAIYTLLKGFAEKHQLYLDKEETRRAALRDVLSDLDSLHWKEHWYADQLRKKIKDRLVSEGA